MEGHQEMNRSHPEWEFGAGAMGEVRLLRVRQEPTFERIAAEWLAGKKLLVKASTYADYDSLIRRHLLPRLGKIQVSSLTSEQIDRFLLEKLQAGRLDGHGGLSLKTVADIRSILKLILQYAQDHGVSCEAGVSVAIPAGDMKSQVFTRTEQAALERFLLARPTPFHMGLLMVLYTGLRIGELCALQWRDIQLEEGLLRVRRTLIRIRDLSPDAPARTKLLFQRPKTANSDRVIPLPDFLLQYCRRSSGPTEAYVLTDSERFMEPRGCLKRYKCVLRQAGVPDHTFHAMRHTFATRCVERGFDIKSLSEIMGHSDIKITMQRYVHPSMELKRQQMNRLTLLAN